MDVSFSRPPSPSITPELTTSSCGGASDVETSFQVVIHYRRRLERKTQDNSPIIVHSNGTQSHRVTIESSAHVFSFGVVTLPPTGTCRFHLVFGSQAGHVTIFHDVLVPMLREVLRGYDRTFFTCGRTGRACVCIIFVLSIIGLIFLTGTQCRAT
jgi:hypothetical protein